MELYLSCLLICQLLEWGHFATSKGRIHVVWNSDRGEGCLHISCLVWIWIRRCHHTWQSISIIRIVNLICKLKQIRAHLLSQHLWTAIRGNQLIHVEFVAILESMILLPSILLYSRVSSVFQLNVPGFNYSLLSLVVHVIEVVWPTCVDHLKRGTMLDLNRSIHCWLSLTLIETNRCVASSWYIWVVHRLVEIALINLRWELNLNFLGRLEIS